MIDKFAFLQIFTITLSSHCKYNFEYLYQLLKIIKGNVLVSGQTKFKT